MRRLGVGSANIIIKYTKIFIEPRFRMDVSEVWNLIGQKGLIDFFNDYLAKDPLLVNKKVLYSNYIPDVILHRRAQIELLASILVPALRKEKPSNVFIYGKTGTGKTLVTQYTLEKLQEAARQKNIPLKHCILIVN